MPSWWGIGTAWKQMSDLEKTEIKALFSKDAFVSSSVKTLGFTLSKVELHIWEKYILEKGHKDSAEIIQAFKKEYELSKKFVFDMSGTRHLIWYRPWLEESIKIRSPYIHILNLLQILAMRDSDEQLLKETLVGIACGMLTTG
jgi:phosphoenolpyruvate carboxylase